MKRTPEFDAFGPWVFQVHNPEDVPRLYRNHPVDLAAAHLVLKVPRSIERRNANPDMDLYDHLLIAGPTSLTVLSRRGGAYMTTEVPYSRVAAVHISVDLLDGLLRVYDTAAAVADGKAVEISYNGVSHDLLTQLAGILRAEGLATASTVAVPPAPSTPPITLSLRDLGDGDIALVSAQHEFAERDGLTTWATHQRALLRRRTGAFRGLRDALLPMSMHAAVVSTGPGELHIVHRRHWFTTGRKPVHSVAHTVVLLPRVTGVEVTEWPAYIGADVVRVSSGISVVEIPFPQSAETGDVLRSVLGVHAR